MPYTILRTAKLTTIGNLAASASHNFRERTTPNADPLRTLQNKTFGAQSSQAVVDVVKTRLELVPTVRKNAVLAIEYFIGASPEWFHGKTEAEREAYFDKAQQWLIDRHGKSNVIAVTRQYDETSPHICAYVVPINDKGRLSASHFLDGKQRLSEMQTHFAETCGKEFGLERGIEGSGAHHTTVREYYGRIQSPTPQVSTEIPPEPQKPTLGQHLAHAVGLETTHTKKQAERDQAIEQRHAEETAQRKAEKAKAKQYDLEKPKNEARERSLAELRESATKARQMPLNAVLERLGATRDGDDKNNWRTPTGRITITGSKFFNHDLDKGGGGAIDLVMQQTETDYKGAVNWLTGQFGVGDVLEESLVNLKKDIEKIARQTPTLDPMKAHQPEPSNWQKVKHYLTETRKLGSSFIENLHQQGIIYADKFKNAVFVLGGGRGLSLRGTGEKPFHGVRGEKVPFELEPIEPSSQKVAFVESPIDALSLRELGFGGRVIATIGTAPETARLRAEQYRDKGLTVVAAFDDDRAGWQMGEALGYPHETMKPKKGKDWNEDLAFFRANPHEYEKALRKERNRGLER